jgi:hypothetical protein
VHLLDLYIYICTVEYSKFFSIFWFHVVKFLVIFDYPGQSWNVYLVRERQKNGVLLLRRWKLLKANRALCRRHMEVLVLIEETVQRCSYNILIHVLTFSRRQNSIKVSRVNSRVKGFTTSNVSATTASPSSGRWVVTLMNNRCLAAYVLIRETVSGMGT